MMDASLDIRVTRFSVGKLVVEMRVSSRLGGGYAKMCGAPRPGILEILDPEIGQFWVLILIIFWVLILIIFEDPFLMDFGSSNFGSKFETGNPRLDIWILASSKIFQKMSSKSIKN